MFKLFIYFSLPNPNVLTESFAMMISIEFGREVEGFVSFIQSDFVP